MKVYNNTNTCDRCRKDGENRLRSHNAYREINEIGYWTGKWLCKSCYSKERYVKGETNSNIQQSLGSRRMGCQNPNSNNAIGDKFQELTCIWRSRVSTIKVEDLNKKNDNYRSPIDHSPDSELGIIDTQGRSYDRIDRMWHITRLERYHNKKVDNIVCYCANEDCTLIKRIYIFPKKEIEKRTSIGIYKNPTDSHGYPKTSWYDKYRVVDEETIKEVNDIWKEIIKE